MEILKVKDDGQDGYLINGTAHVPSVEYNRHYQEVQEWIENGGVVEPFETSEEINVRETAEANALIHQELEDLDNESIRDIREWIASQPNAPQGLKDREAAAISARGRLQ